MNKKLILSASQYGISLLKAKIKPTITFTNLFYTRRCNLSCSYCTAYKKASKKELSLKEWKDCSDILYKLGNRSISMVGGEPLIREDVIEFIKYISKKKIISSLITNAILLNNNKIKELEKAGLINLGISTQSLIPNKKEKCQNPELFDLLIKHKKNLEASALTTITNKNYKEVPEIAKFVIKKGLRFAPNMITSGKNFWFRNYCPELQFTTKEQKEGLKKTIKELIKIKKETKKIIYSEHYLKSLYLYAINPDFKWYCDAGKNYLSINDDGYVMYCQDLEPTKINYKDLDKYYPLKQNNCKNCVWPCYYDESYRIKHPIKFFKENLSEI